MSIVDKLRLRRLESERAALFSDIETRTQALIKEVEERDASNLTDNDLSDYEELEVSLRTDRDRLAAMDLDIDSRRSAIESIEKLAVAEDNTGGNDVKTVIAARGDNVENLTLREALTRQESKDFLQAVRDIGARRAVTNAALLVPDIFLGMIEQIAVKDSVLAHIRVIDAHGNANLIISGNAPEGVWIDCCGDLAELSIGFNNWTFGCWGVGGYISVCNAMLDDSDINLAQFIINSIAQAIIKAVEKAVILTGTGTGMPMSISTRLGQTSQPSGWSTTAPTWVNLSATNQVTLNPAAAAGDFFASLASVIGVVANKYTTGNLFWIMNSMTYATVLSKAIGFNSAGVVVANGGMFNENARSLPLIGGTVLIRDWMPANVIIGGYGEGYILVRRQGVEFRRADELRMLNNQTVFAGFARYDGYPVIAEGFAKITLTIPTGP